MYFKNIYLLICVCYFSVNWIVYKYLYVLLSFIVVVLVLILFVLF